MTKGLDRSTAKLICHLAWLLDPYCQNVTPEHVDIMLCTLCFADLDEL